MSQFSDLGLDLSGQPTADVVSKKGLAQVLEVHPSRVTQLIGQGMPTEPNGRVSIAKARAWISENVDPNRRKMLQPNGHGAARSGSSAVRLELDGTKLDRARIDLERLRGNLVDRQAAEAAIFARARAERDAHMAWVVRTAPMLAVKLGVDAAVVLAMMDVEMRRHLEDLAARPLSELLA